MTTEPTSDPKSLFDFSVKDAKGDLVNLSTYKGKVLLIVNVASKCGLTNSNYTELNQLYDKYKDQGLEILAFPCNQFHEQEPETSDKIVEFVCTRFKSEFPIFDKIEVNGDNSAPLFKFLKSGKWGIIGVMIFSGTLLSFWLIRMAKLLVAIILQLLPLALSVTSISYWVFSNGKGSTRQ